MEMEQIRTSMVAMLAAVLLTHCAQQPACDAPASRGGPRYQVDPFWPKPLREDWMLGQVAGIAVDSRGHIWAYHRPGTLLDDEKGLEKSPPQYRCCKPAPAVIEFDRDGNYVRGWGGPGPGYEWPKVEHGIYVDPQDHVWIAGNSPTDHQILKFTRDGKFLLQIGRAGKSEGSNSRTQLGRPAHMMLDAAANELYVADGYGNRRVIVFDATSGQYKRHWGAYGGVPSDEKLPPYDPAAPLAKQFGNPVHCVRISSEGLVYVCDRANDRIQVFRKNGEFVREYRVEVETLANGSVWDMVLSPDPVQRDMFIADGSNGQIYIHRREDGERTGVIGRMGRMAGEFKWIHNLAIDNEGNLYTAEVGSGRRVQKFRLVN